jgi:pSer/pThr/pTyr-binding forkhead associated (FHA) protein
MSQDLTFKLRDRVRYRVRSLDQAVLLGEGEVVIGRSPYCSLIIDQETLSRVHASLRIVGDGVELTDLGSSNGTFVNGQRLTTPKMVGPGDKIVLGKVKIWIEIASARISRETGPLLQLRHEPDETVKNPSPEGHGS